MSLQCSALLQEASWKAERERLCRDKVTLQRECRQLLERLQELQGLVRALSIAFRDSSLRASEGCGKLAARASEASHSTCIVLMKASACFGY